MQSVMDWGLQVIIFIQQFRSPLLDQIFEGITFLGEEQFYLLFLAALMWAVNFRIGAGLAIAFLFSVYINSVAKDILDLPRPFNLDPGVQVVRDVEGLGGGLPSGHAQNGLVVWGGLAAWARRPWVWTLAVLIIVLLGLSRVYLGVHFPTDIVGGYAIGAVILAFYLRWHEVIARTVGALPLGTQLLIALLVPVVLLLVWRTADTVSAMATLAGLATGLVLQHRYVRFDAGGPAWQRAVRFLIGAIGLLVFYIGLSVVFPGEGSPAYSAFRFLRYGLLGMWATLGAPWVFGRLRLANAGLVARARP